VILKPRDDLFFQDLDKSNLNIKSEILKMILKR